MNYADKHFTSLFGKKKSEKQQQSIDLYIFKTPFRRSSITLHNNDILSYLRPKGLYETAQVHAHLHAEVIYDKRPRKHNAWQGRRLKIGIYANMQRHLTQHLAINRLTC